tara:strand:+ start:2559 stop:3017 length:459 start_codon:yes stop_codon:yes gene_type:complete
MRFLALIGFIVWAGASFGQIRVSESVQDLGDIFENRGKVTAKFNLQNPYRTDTIRIIDIVSSCGCTAVLAEDTLILPQTNITLEVTYDPAESEKRLKAAMELKLIDPNRIIFTDELAIIQGPEYDGTIPILKYREFHYIRIIPEQTLNPNGK